MTSIKYRGMEYLWNGDNKYWGRHAPILFPIVGRLINGKTLINGKEYEMKQHGFARDQDFTLVEVTSTSITYKLKNNVGTLKQYPYCFELVITYEVVENMIKVTYLVKNLNEYEMLFSIGGHPAFCWPLNKEEKFEDYEIKFSEKETTKLIALEDRYSSEVDKLFFENEDTILLSKDIFKIDTLVFKDLKSDTVTFRSKKSNSSVTMNFEGFPYLGIWTGKNDAPFICLEPWYGIADYDNSNGIFEEKPGINRLEVGKSFECSYTIQLT